MNWFPTLELQEKVRTISTRLQAVYHAEAPLHGGGSERLSPVSELVLTFLSQSTTDTNSWRGYQALQAKFADWEAMADAPVEEIEAAIRPCGLSRQKAPRIKAMLQQLREEHGHITLDFLADMPPDEALAYLMSFHGVGRKTASCVLLFSLGMPAMPVDTHVLRLARRLALIPEQTGADEAHDLLESLLPEELYLVFHVNMIAHGRQTCFAQHPACERCAISDLCPFGTQLIS
jgi:endonuclease-3